MAKKFVKALDGLPFSKAVIHNDPFTLEISGQIGLNPETGKLEEGIEKQTEATFESIKNILNEVKWDLGNLTKVRIFLTDMTNYSKVNEIYPKYFKDDFPARVALAVKELPLGALIEIDCTASGNIFEE